MKTKIRHEVAVDRVRDGYRWKPITPEEYALMRMSGDFAVLRRVRVHWYKPNQEIDTVEGSVKFPEMWFY